MIRKRFTEIEIEIIKESLKRNITIEEIAESLGRNKDTIQKKVWLLGLKRQGLLDNKLEREKAKEQIEKRKKELIKKDESETKELLRIHPYLTREWQEVLSMTGSKISEWKGQRVLMMSGKPTSVQEIRARYNLLLKAHAAQDIQEAPAVLKPYLAKC